ncbi:MAG: hypothetical protein V4513_07965 [Pseudomonadota bacterium]
MSVLKKLKLSNAARVHVADNKQNARAKLLRHLQEQKAVAEAELEGRAYTATKVVFRTGENGQRVRGEAPRHVRRGWFRDAAGVLFFQARYGNKPLDLGKGMTSIEVGSLEALSPVLDALIEATDAGELDEALALAGAERRSNFKNRRNSS